MLTPHKDKALYVCEYCRSVNALTYLPKEFDDKKLRRQRENIFKEREAAYTRFYLMIGIGELLAFIVTFHLGLFKPFDEYNYLDSAYDYTAPFVDIILLWIAAIAGLFAPIKTYYITTYEYSRHFYNISQILIVSLIIYDMLISDSAIVRVFGIHDLSSGVTFLFGSLLAAVLLIYPLYRSLIGKNYRWMQ